MYLPQLEQQSPPGPHRAGERGGDSINKDWNQQWRKNMLCAPFSWISFSAHWKSPRLSLSLFKKVHEILYHSLKKIPRDSFSRFFWPIETFITTEGALRWPMTFDNHPSHPHIALKTTSHGLKWSCFFKIGLLISALCLPDLIFFRIETLAGWRTFQYHWATALRIQVDSQSNYCRRWSWKKISFENNQNDSQFSGMSTSQHGNLQSRPTTAVKGASCNSLYQFFEDAVSQFCFRQRPDTRTMMRLKRSPEGKNHVRQNKMRKTETGKNHVRQNEI